MSVLFKSCKAQSVDQKNPICKHWSFEWGHLLCYRTITPFFFFNVACGCLFFHLRPAGFLCAWLTCGLLVILAGSWACKVLIVLVLSLLIGLENCFISSDSLSCLTTKNRLCSENTCSADLYFLLLPAYEYIYFRFAYRIRLQLMLFILFGKCPRSL